MDQAKNEVQREASVAALVYGVPLHSDAILSGFQSNLVQSAVGLEAAITGAFFMQDLRPCPIRVDVDRRGGKQSVVLRISRNQGGVEREALVLPILKELGIPVPAILVQPASDPDAPELFSMSVIEFLSGETLQAIAGQSDIDQLRAADLLVEGITLVHGATNRLRELGELAVLPAKTLSDELEEICNRGGEWLERSEVSRALDRIAATLELDAIPMVFSNGDYQPANFLSDGRQLTGILDFEKSAFMDPLISLARIAVYDLRPLCEKATLEHCVRRLGFEPEEFALRVAIFCLRTLQRKTPPFGGTAAQVSTRERILDLMGTSVSMLN